MLKLNCLAALIGPLLVSLTVCADTPRPDPATGQAACSDATLSLDAVSQAFDRAQFEKDGATLDCFLADDLVFIRGSGVQSDRQTFIDYFSDPNIVFEPFEISDREIRSLGDDVGIVFARATFRGVQDGEAFEDSFRYADIFERRRGLWRVIFVQVTPLAASE